MMYKEFKAWATEQINAVPMAFAFNGEQLNEAMVKLGATSKAELSSIGGGGIMLKGTEYQYSDAVLEIEAKLDALRGDDAFLRSAFIYELSNHEYCITCDPTDAVEAVGLELDNLSDREHEILQGAIQFNNDNNVGW